MNEIESVLRKVVKEELAALNEREFMNAKEAAEFLRITQPTLRRAVRFGEIKATVIGGVTRFRKSDLLAAGYQKYSH